MPLDVIARRAGVGSGTLYRHFSTREVLVEAAYRGDITALTEAGVALAASRDPGEALERWVRDYLVPAQRQPGIATVFKEALNSALAVFAQIKQQFNYAANDLVAAAQGAGTVRPDIETHDILRLAYGIALASDGAPEACQRMLTIAFDGLRPI